MLRFALILSLLANADGGPAPLRRVSGTASHIQTTHPCRGGAAVMPEEIHSQTTPLAGQTVTVLQGAPDGVVVAKAKADAAGHFELRLPPGRYCVRLGDVGPERAPEPPSPLPPAGQYTDARCMWDRAHPAPRCDANVEVGASDVGGLVVATYGSNTCSQQWAQPCWRGPMPP